MSPFEASSPGIYNHASLAEAALAYAAAGIPVLPLRPREKQPIVSGGFKSATTNTFLIRRWWRETPLANIGVVCGEPSGWWVLDIDPRHGGLASLKRLQQAVDRLATPGTFAQILATRRQLTGGGGAHQQAHLPVLPRREPLGGKEKPSSATPERPTSREVTQDQGRTSVVSSPPLSQAALRAEKIAWVREQCAAHPGSLARMLTHWQVSNLDALSDDNLRRIVVSIQQSLARTSSNRS